MSINFDQMPIGSKKFNQGNDLNTFDEVPIGIGANKFAISEYAQGQSQQPQISTTNMTLEQKVYSKAVKVKLQGLEQLRECLGDIGKCHEIEIQLAKILKQNNPACLEKALQCAQKWMEIGGSWGEKQIKEIVDNGYVNGKGATKKLATDLVYKAFETRPEEVERTFIETGFKGKVPKVVGGYLALLNQLLQQFGVKDLKYLKPYIPVIVQVMNNEKLPVVKNEGMNVFKSGLKWLGKDFLWPMFSELKQNMKKQLETFWEGHDKNQIMKANRLKSAPAVKNEVNLKTKGKQATRNESEMHSGSLDIYQISDPIEVFQKFDERWTLSVLEAQKWDAKTTLLQQITTKLSVPKIANTEHRHITEMIRRLINDSNFNVVLAVLKLSGAMAKGLRKNFSHSAKLLFPYITPKFRDKKTQMIEETNNTLNNFCYCFSIQQVGEDIKTALKDKAAGMKNNIIKWMTNFVEKRQAQTGSDRVVQFLKSSSIQNIIEGLLNDPSADVRDSTTKLVCKVRTIFGEGLFKNIDKNISNKDILQKLADGVDQQGLSKSRNKDTSSKKVKSQSKGKSSKKQEEEAQQMNKNSYAFKANGKSGDTVDITEQLNKTMKKLNDNSNWQNRKDSAERLSKYFNQLEKQNSNVKITSPILYDFLGVLKARIADPNKQLIKIFVSLVGDTFKFLNQKQAKIQSKSFMQELIEALSDKNELNRKEIFRTFDRISTSIGHETMTAYLGQILSQQSTSSSASNQSGSITKQFTFQYLLGSPYFINKIDQIESLTNLKQFKDYPKIILSGLCDKNKDLRAASQKMFKAICEKTGTEPFRAFVNSKEQKLAFKGDLILFLDKFEGLNANQQPSMISVGSNLSGINKQEAISMKRSPSMNKSKLVGKQENQAADKSRRKLSNATSLCNSRSKGKNNSILSGCQQNSKDLTSNLSFYLKGEAPHAKRIVEGTEPFASVQLLTAQRISREQNSTKYRNSGLHPISQELQIQAAISRLFNYDQLYQRMYSSDYIKNLQAAQKIIKLCRDVAQTNAIREVHDLLMKWIVVKMYGGNVCMLGLMEMICPLLNVLEKKRIAWSDSDIEVLVSLMREYLIAIFYDGNENLQVLKNIFKFAIALSSGQRILRKILVELKTDINQQHRHLAYSKREGTSGNKFYKRMLTQICGYFIDYFSNDDMLSEAATIPELSQNPEFIKLLSNKFHEGVLKEFGFRSAVQKEPINEGIKLEKSFLNAQLKALNSPREGSPIAYFGSKEDQRGKKVTPQKKNSGLNESQYPPPSPIIKTRPPMQTLMEQTKKQQLTVSSICKIIGIQPFPPRYQIDITGFVQPSHHNPLGSNLHKLYPFNESTIHFFSTLFQPQNQSSDKITTQLSTHCNLIYSSLFNTLIKVMELSIREHQGPQKISIYMSLIQQSIKCPSIYKNLQQNIIERSIRYTIDQLVYEDENRNSIQLKLRARGFNEFKSDIFVKGINGIMLRLLDNSYPMFLINVLLFSMLEVMLEARQESHHFVSTVNRSKKMGLLIRCFNRVTTTYFNPSPQKQKQPQNLYNIEQDASCLKPSHITKFFLLLKQYLTAAHITDLIQFQARQNSKQKATAGLGATSTCTTSNNNEQSVIVCFYKIMRMLNRKNLLAKSYEQVQKDNNWNERVIGDYVMAVSGISTHSIDIYHALTSNNYIDMATYGQAVTMPKMDEEFKKIVQLLSKTKTFAQGVKNLKFYIQQNGGKFDYKTIFSKMSFEPAFIEKVTEELNKLNIMSSQGSNMGPARSLNPDIQNKLQRLKMKLQGINNEHSKSISSKMPEEVDQSNTTIRSHYPTLNLSNLALNGQKGPEVQTPRAREISTKSKQHSGFTAQNDLKKRIEEMKNKVSMSTSSNGGTAGFSNTNTSKIR